MALPSKKSYQPPSKVARDNYYARKTVDEVLKAQVTRRTARAGSSDANHRNRYGRRLKRTLQAVQALPSHQTTESLAKTGAIRAALTIKLDRNKEAAFAQGAGKVGSAGGLNRFQSTAVDNTVDNHARAPATPTTYDAPMSPPPAPRKPKQKRTLDKTAMTHDTEGMRMRIIKKDEWK